MSVQQRKRYMRAFVIVSLQALASLPSLAVDSEAIAKKQLCHTCLKDIYLAERRTPEAMVEFQELLKLSPNNARLHFDYANLLAQMQKLPLAAAQYQQAARIQPGVAEYQGGMGNGFMYTKRYDMAVSAYTRACQLGGRFEKQLQMAQQYQAQQKQLVQYEKKIEQKKEDDEE